MPPPETPGHSWASLGQSFVGSLLLSPGFWFCLWPPRVYFPVLCEFWQLCGGINGDLLQEGLCHTQVCCTQSPALWESTADPQETLKHSFGSVCVGSLGPGVHKVCLSSPCLTPCQISRTNTVLGIQKMIFMKW